MPAHRVGCAVTPFPFSVFELTVELVSALANILLLQGKISWHPDYAQISAAELLALLSDYLLNNKPVVRLAMLCSWLKCFAD